MTVDANGLVIGSIAPDGYQPSGPEMQLLRGVCHDVGQELAVIQVLGGLVVRATAGLPDDVRRRLDEMTARASYVAQMMSDAVEGRTRSEDVDVTEIVVRAAADIRLRSRVSCRAAGRQVRLFADVALLRRAVINLLDNAVRAAGPAGTVLVRVWPSHTGAVIEVDDSGPGWGNAPRGRASLGLDIVRQCADAHGGSVVFGTSELGGARVRLSLPDGAMRSGSERDSRGSSGGAAEEWFGGAQQLSAKSSALVQHGLAVATGVDEAGSAQDAEVDAQGGGGDTELMG
jgi:K+-sensing histidine kinase KdpD